jgi:hypothetical protein
VSKNKVVRKVLVIDKQGKVNKLDNEFNNLYSSHNIFGVTVLFGDETCGHRNSTTIRCISILCSV